MSKSPSYLERLLPASHTHIELSSFLKETNDSPTHKDHSELLEKIHEKFHRLNLFLKLQVLQILTTTIKVFILTGQLTLFYFDKLMRIFRCTPRKKLLISFSTPIYNLLGTGLFPKKFALILSIIMLTLTFLVSISVIYFWLIEKKENILASDQDTAKSNNNNPIDEPMGELSYRTAAFLALLEQAKTNTDAQGNIPNELAVKLITARRDVISLSNDLYVVPELVLNGDENCLTKAQINSFPIENYTIDTFDSEPDTCSLCVKDYKEKEEMRKLSCGHRFHKKCADDWLEKLSICPNCKIELRVDEDLIMN